MFNFQISSFFLDFTIARHIIVIIIAFRDFKMFYLLFIH